MAHNIFITIRQSHLSCYIHGLHWKHAGILLIFWHITHGNDEDGTAAGAVKGGSGGVHL